VWAWVVEQSALPNRDNLSLLDARERERIERLRFVRDQIRYAVSHLNVRRILGGYLQQHPADIGYSIGPFGRPCLLPDNSGRVIHFNLSHTQDFGLLAVTEDYQLGIDAEVIRAINPKVADANFSPCELQQLNALKGQAWLESFYKCWTRKEAVLKAEGMGLNIALNAFDVAIEPDESHILNCRPPNLLTFNWHLFNLRPASNVTAALAVSDVPEKCACFHFSE
jgi:4'-phosphopantetheinyl transferase